MWESMAPGLPPTWSICVEDAALAPVRHIPPTRGGYTSEIDLSLTRKAFRYYNSYGSNPYGDPELMGRLKFVPTPSLKQFQEYA